MKKILQIGRWAIFLDKETAALAEEVHPTRVRKIIDLAYKYRWVMTSWDADKHIVVLNSGKIPKGKVLQINYKMMSVSTFVEVGEMDAPVFRKYCSWDLIEKILKNPKYYKGLGG